MAHCRFCGAGVSDQAGFCQICGKDLRTPVNQAQTYPVQSGSPNAAGIILIVTIILLVAICGGFIVYQVDQEAAVSQQTSQSVSLPAANPPTNTTSIVQADSQKTMASSNSGVPVFSGQQAEDFRRSVEEKERINSNLIELAGKANSRVNSYGHLRGSEDLKYQAKQLYNEVQSYSNDLAYKTFPSEYQNSKNLLMQLYGLELTRARSLYNGLVEGNNGQNYQSSFSVGTNAAYKFDEVESQFVREYSNLQGKMQ